MKQFYDPYEPERRVRWWVFWTWLAIIGGLVWFWVSILKGLMSHV